MSFGFGSICTAGMQAKTCSGPEESRSNQIRACHTERKQASLDWFGGRFNEVHPKTAQFSSRV